MAKTKDALSVAKRVDDENSEKEEDEEERKERKIGGERKGQATSESGERRGAP